MSAYSEDYCYSHDIDCFFIVNGGQQRFIHFASNGNLLPPWIDEEVNERFREELSEALSQFEDILEVNTLLNNVKYLIHKDGIEYDMIYQRMIDNYTSSFIMMAKLGFNSYDMNEGRFYLIAEPSGTKSPLQKERLTALSEWLQNASELIPRVSEAVFKQLVAHSEAYHVIK